MTGSSLGSRVRGLIDSLARPAWLSYVVLASSALVTAASLVERSRSELTEVNTEIWVATVLLAVVMVLAWRRHSLGLPSALDRRVVLALSLLLLVLAVVGPVRRSHDLWSYTMYGREVSVHHVDPYTHVPSEFPSDPFLERVSPVWRSTGSVYGPLFTGYSALSTKLAGDSVLANRLAFQGLAGLSVLASLLLLVRRRVDPAAIACLGMHPLVIVFAVGGGHNDPVVGLAILGAVLLARSRRLGWAGIVIGLGALVKIVAGLAAVALLVWLWSTAGALRRRSITRLLVGCGGVVVAGYALAGGPSALGPLSSASKHVGWASFWEPVKHALRGTALAPDISSFAALTVLVVAGLLMYRHRNDLGPELIVMSSLLAYQLCSAYVLAWYLLWILPVGVMFWRTLTGQSLLAYATAILFSSTYRPDPHERLENLLFAHGNALHVFSLVLVGVLVGAAIAGRPRSPSADDAGTGVSATSGAEKLPIGTAGAIRPAGSR